MTNSIPITIHKFSKKNCRPCAALSYALKSIDDKLTKADAVVVEHDIEFDEELIQKYAITGVPLMVFERNGQEITRLNGLVSADEIVDAVDYAKEAR